MPALSKIKQELLAEHSRRNVDRLANETLANPHKWLKPLVTLVITNTNEANRAAWVLEKTILQKPELLTNYIDALSQCLPKLSNSGARCLIAKILTFYPLSLKYQDALLDYCFKVLESASEPPAVKANCMSLAFKFTIHYPDIKQELCQIIEHQMPHEKPSYKSRYKNLLLQYTNK